jgi:hypothetical protein
MSAHQTDLKIGVSMRAIVSEMLVVSPVKQLKSATSNVQTVKAAV